MFARQQLIHVMEEWLALAKVIHPMAMQTKSLVMPGYTHYQSAQIVTVGFYLAAFCEKIIKIIRRLLNLFDALNEYPLGSGALAGLELKWDRKRLANELVFSRPCRHALNSVAFQRLDVAHWGRIIYFIYNTKQIYY